MLILSFLFITSYFDFFFQPEIEIPEPEPMVEERVVEVFESNLPVECNQYYNEVNKYDWDADLVMQVMKLESGCNSNAKNDNPNTGDYSIGLMQINLYGKNALYRPSEEELKIPEKNIAFAYELYKNGGFAHWTVYEKYNLGYD